MSYSRPHDATNRNARALQRADRLIVDCLARLRFPLHGSLPYLVGLLRCGDDLVARDVLAYIRTWRMTAAVPHLRSLLARDALSGPVRGAAREALDALRAPPGRTVP